MIPQITPLTSDTPRLHQHVSRSPVARRHANALSTKAAQIPMALQHHKRRVATRSAHTLQANMPHDTTNHPAHQRHAAFTPACFALPSAVPRKCTFHQVRANPNGTATSRTSRRHAVCPHTRSKHISPTKAAQIPMALQHHERNFATRSAHTLEANISHETANHPAHQRHDTPHLHQHVLRSSWRGAMQTHFPPRPRKSQWHCNITNVIWPHVLPIHYKSRERFVRDFLQKSRFEAARQAFRTRLSPKVTRQVSKRSFRTRLPPSPSFSYETSSKSHTSSLQNERFVRDFLKNSHVKVCKTSFSYETQTSSKGQAETPIGAHTSRSPAKQFRDSSPSKQHANPNVTATFTSTTTHNLAIPCACRKPFRVHTSNAHKVLRLPRNVTSVTPRNLTIPCACHENRTSTPQNPHKVLRLPRKVIISSHVSFNKICTTPHVWDDFDPF